jgi:hypothetical protein
MRSSEQEVAQARMRALRWLREPHRNPRFLLDHDEADLRNHQNEITERFLSWITNSGFHAEMIELTHDDEPAFEIRWSHKGASFVGFKQPPYAATKEDARILGCSALLENEWCRRRLH